MTASKASAAFWTAAQLRQLADSRRNTLQVARYNPNPQGIIKSSGTTVVVLGLLRSNAKRWHTHHDILSATGRTKAGVDWALLYLRKLQLVETCGDDARNPLYLRYRASSESA